MCHLTNKPNQTKLNNEKNPDLDWKGNVSLIF